MATDNLVVTRAGRLRTRLEALVDETRKHVSADARRAVDKSAIGRLAIRQLLDRYETAPAELAAQLGFVIGEREGG